MTDQKVLNSFKRSFVDPMSRLQWNVVSFRKGWTGDTMRATVEICLWAWENDLDFACEVRMLNGLRPDIIIPGLVAPVIEIRDSEDYKNVQRKTMAYRHVGLDLVCVDARDFRQAVNFLKTYNGLL